MVYLLLQEIVWERQKKPTILNNSRHMLKKELQPVLMDTWKWNRNSRCAFIRQQFLVPLIIFKVYQSLLTALSPTQLEEHQVLLYQHKQKHLITSVGAGSFKLLKKVFLGMEVALWKSPEPHSSFIPTTHGSDLIQAGRWMDTAIAGLGWYLKCSLECYNITQGWQQIHWNMTKGREKYTETSQVLFCLVHIKYPFISCQSM